jgi:hypothetical protein
MFLRTTPYGIKQNVSPFIKCTENKLTILTVSNVVPNKLNYEEIKT